MAKIVVIDDNSAIRELVREILVLQNHQVLEAANGITGVNLVQAELPDLVICDIMMPHLDGFAVLSRLQSDSKTATIPFIFLTAKNEIGDMRQAMQLGADDYLVKPFAQAELIKTVELRIQKKRSIQNQYQQAIQKEVDYLLTHDSLTQLPNQLALRQIFEEKVNQCNQKEKLALISLCLDKFDSINQTFGHEAGNQLLKAAITRIKEAIDKNISLIRVEGVKFILLLSPINDLAIVLELLEKINQKFLPPFFLFNQEIRLKISQGVAIYPQDAKILNNLIQKADQARGWLKKNKEEKYKLYSQIFTNQTSINYFELDLQLRHGLKYKQFIVYYQPQINLKNLQIVGAEALLRWHHPLKGIIGPINFIPVAEKIGLIKEIGDYVLKSVWQQNYLWQKEGMGPIRLAVNLSASQFKQPDFWQFLQNTVNHYPVEKEYLELEITESVMLENFVSSALKLRQLQNLGIKIAMDDFGTGYSSFSYLQKLPIDILKIDRSFIKNIGQDEKSATIIATLIDLAHKLKLRVIAEGVETEEELDFLRSHDCDEAQGYLFSMPLPAADFTKLLQSQKNMVE